jgi:hypothetical protein
VSAPKKAQMLYFPETKWGKITTVAAGMRELEAWRRESTVSMAALEGFKAVA